jgi:signal transduction histidine kinase/AmiR/NasT family two-component response regulator
VNCQEDQGVFTRQRLHREPSETNDRGVLRAARNGANREEWIRAATEELKSCGETSRIGAWLEPPMSTVERDDSLVFRGLVWDRESEGLPKEWTRLSPDAPLPRELLNSGKSIEWSSGGLEFEPLLGPLLEMERALWVPVMKRRILCGLLLVATRERQKALPKAAAERVAAELGLLVELEEERRLARERQADLGLIQKLQGLLATEECAGNILMYLAANCTNDAPDSAAGAVFALIGERQGGLPVATPSDAGGAEQLVVLGQSGDVAWAHSVDHGPLENLWRQAVESRRVVGGPAERLPLAKEISRIVAIPLCGKEEVYGVLIAGLPRRHESFGMLERLELRALLAARVLEQKRHTEQAMRARSWQKALLESSEAPTVLVDRYGFLLGLSRGARDLTRNPGSTEMAITRETRFAELFRPKDWEQANHWAKSAFAKEPNVLEPFVAELRSAGSVRLRRLVISENEFLAVGLELATEESSAVTPEQLEAEFQQALEWLEEGVVVFDRRGCIRALNARFLQIMGLATEERPKIKTMEELVERVAKNATEPGSFAAAWRGLDEAMEEEIREELMMDWPVPQVIERSARRIVDRKGARLGRVEVYREMTAKRMFQSRMVQTEKLASLGQQVTEILHELSNPLTSILGNAQRMVLRNPHSATSEIQGLLSEAERATAILRQLLYLSRESPPKRRAISLKELVERTAGLQKVMLAGHSIELKIAHAEGLPRIEGDFAQLQQVLLNLLQNAQQALEQSGRGSTIGVRTSVGEDRRVRLEVWDDGPGVPSAIQTRIFDPFFTTKAAGAGTGLGLAIVMGFVRQHGGTLKLVSPPEGGSRFVLEFPAAKDDGQPEEPRPDVQQPEQTPSLVELLGHHLTAGEIPGKIPARILVVEDEPTVAALIADILRDEGMRVDVLLESQSAVRQAELETYDLLICDLKMQGVDGQMIYQTLVQRQNPLCEHVLFVTGDVLSPRTQEFLERHRLPHVAKPFRMEELSLAVKDVLQRKTAAALRAEATKNRAAGNG